MMTTFLFWGKLSLSLWWPFLFVTLTCWFLELWSVWLVSVGVVHVVCCDSRKRPVIPGGFPPTPGQSPNIGTGVSWQQEPLMTSLAHHRLGWQLAGIAEAGILTERWGKPKETKWLNECIYKILSNRWLIITFWLEWRICHFPCHYEKIKGDFKVHVS